MVDKLPAMLAYWDADRRCRFANHAYKKWFGVDPEALVGHHIRELLGPLYELNLPYIEGALRGEEQEFEREIPDPAGGPPRHSHALYVPDTLGGKTRGFAVLVTDVTRLKAAEATLALRERQLATSERLAAMSTLAAGIAHEINNPLTLVQGNLDLAAAALAHADRDSAAVEGALHAARDGARRIRDIMDNMKLLGRGDPTRRARVDIDEVLEQSLAYASNALHYRARLVRELGNAGRVLANPSQLAQVFVNLLVNASQALPEDTSRSEIRVTSRREETSVVVEVADNGCGIPPDVQSRIFEPFFTTKDVGGGTGLGLAISTGILEAFGGTISVASTVGQGSVFTVRLPAAPDESSDAPRSSAPHEASAAPTQRLRILVIDDEPQLGRLIRRLLADRHDVRATSSAREALALLTGASPPAFDLILCDVMMPEMSGEKLYGQVTATRPELARRFGFMTGGAFTPEARAFLATLDAPALEKPFDLETLEVFVAEHALRVAS